MTVNVLIFSVNGEKLQPMLDAGAEGSLVVAERKSTEAVQKELLSQKYDLLLSRCERFDPAQVELLALIRQNKIPTRTVIIAKLGTVEDAVLAMKLGARDFVIARELSPAAIRSMIPEDAFAGSVAARLSDSEAPPEMIGECVAIKEVKTAVALVADSPAAVLITGESGTGKEVVARLVHYESKRRNRPFVAVNCAALPKDVIENELFGHERGAFTGALAKKLGAFELAIGGTLFFDEIAEMDPDTQAKLLRAIEQKAFRRLGGSEEVTVDVRIVAATNRDIPSALSSGAFREDLYYRFSVIEIEMPPLRNRFGDVPLLIEHFLAEFSRKYERSKQAFSPEAMLMLSEYAWPGNIRELRNIIERTVVTRPESVIEAHHLPSRITNSQPTGGSLTIPAGTSFSDVERMLILHTLASVQDNRSLAARILGLSRKTLHNKLKQYAEEQQPVSVLDPESKSPAS